MANKKETEIVAMLNHQIGNAVGGDDSSLESDQSDALDHYYGRKYGNEVEGRSKVVTHDLMETIEWMMPALLKPFISGSKYVEFDPVSQEDIPMADQETKAVNHIIGKKNNPVYLFYCWFKDALLMRNGYVKAEYNNRDRKEKETYNGLSEQEYIALVSEEGIDVDEYEEYQTEFGIFYNVKISRSFDDGCVELVNVASEDILYSRDLATPFMDDASFVAHRQEKTESDLIEAGYNRKAVESIPDSYFDDGELEYSRDTVAGESDYHFEEIDKSQRKITVYDCYVLMDSGSGVSERRNIVMAGNKILYNEEYPFVPISSISSVIVPHKHIGLSVDDLLADIQFINTELMRQTLDNLYRTNNPRPLINDELVNIEDVLNNAHGHPIRTKSMDAYVETVTPFAAEASLRVASHVEAMKEARTGISRHNAGMDADVLKQSTEGAFLKSIDKGLERMELIVRLFAETGVKDLFRKVHALTQLNRDTEMIMKLSGEYVPLNPSQWRDRTDLTVLVGMGSGNDREKLSKLWAIAEKQEQMIMNGIPIVQPKNLYNTYDRIVDLSGLRDVEKHFINPDDLPPPPEPGPDPQMELVKAQLEIERGKVEILQQEKQVNAAIDRAKLDLDEREQAFNEYIAKEKLDLEASKNMTQAELKDRELDIKASGVR